MLKEYKKAFVALINTLDLERIDYVILEEEMTDGAISYRLTFKIVNTQMTFSFLNSMQSWNLFKYTQIQFHPDYKQFRSDRWLSFEDCLLAFQVWVNDQLKKYLEEKERMDYLGLYLDNLASELRSLKFPTNSNFSIYEHVIIDEYIVWMCAFLEENYADETNLEVALRSIGLLEGYSRSKGRNDWHVIASSTAMFVILELNMNQENGQFVLRKTIDLMLELLAI